MSAANSLQSYVEEKFQAVYGERPQGLFAAPGRVNIIGEHTDYNDGFVLPASIQFQTCIAASLREDDVIEARALDIADSCINIDLKGNIERNSRFPWSDYLAGVVIELRKRGYPLKGVNLVISGNIPQGAGLSSSASLEVAIVSALKHLHEFEISGETAALIGQAAENNFVGCNCGIMDQLVAALGKKDHAMLLDCRSLEKEYVCIPEDLDLIIINSNVKRGLVDSEYNIRRQQCESAAKQLGVRALRDIGFDLLEKKQKNMDELVYHRARHVVTENARTQLAAQALAKADMSHLSELMDASHRSMRDDFEITVAPIDRLVEIVKSVIGDRGGVRMTGGGFGGCVLALVPKALSSEVVVAVDERYKSITGLKESIYICTTSNGGFIQQSSD